ncbi:MAG: response regulator [candidate division FCPU426 bacterium]
MKILIVDDSKAMRMIIRRILRQAGFQDVDAEEAVNGKDALEKIKTVAPDLVFLDWNMPEMNGIEVAQNLKQSGSPIKYGFVTSEGTQEMKQLAMDAGANFFICKPFTVETFQSELAGILS